MASRYFFSAPAATSRSSSIAVARRGCWTRNAARKSLWNLALPQIPKKLDATKPDIPTRTGSLSTAPNVPNVIDPRAEYAQRLEDRLGIVAARDRLHVRLGNAKLATLVIGAVLAWLSLSKGFFSPWWLSAAVFLYSALVVLHERAVQSRDCAQSAAVFYRQGLARIEDRWPGSGQSGDRFRDANHLYTDDLDIFGRGCLFELLSSARTPMGENRLADWLRGPSPLNSVLERQKLVTMLREKLDLREHLAVIGENLRAKLDPQTLATWAEAPATFPWGRCAGSRPHSPWHLSSRWEFCWPRAIFCRC